MKKAENDKKALEGRKKDDTKKACITAAEAGGATVVRKGGKDAGTEQEKAAAIKANLESQNQSKPGTARRVTMEGTGRFAGNAWIETTVDAETAVNDVNKDNEIDYFCIVINGILKPLDCIASDDTIRKCISFAKHCVNIVRSSITSDDNQTSVNESDDEIVPDSGATLHMRRNRSVFEDDYVTCNDVFVLMGDGTEIPVLGYGTPRMKFDGHVTRLINSLHVPGLNCDLFSCT